MGRGTTLNRDELPKHFREMWVAFNAWLRRVWLSHSCKLLQDTTHKKIVTASIVMAVRKNLRKMSSSRRLMGETVTMNDDNNNCEPL